MKHLGGAAGGDDESSGRKAQRGGAGRGQGRKAIGGEVRKPGGNAETREEFSQLLSGA